ncbi:membrane-bound alkaline phosphatase-like [Teleopsis dalmanni]|uniref:membrane-bound alkaline phosphatase-like n=1 Tax=Teleopsis dalmanni TaxID=139649 RepID=UPI000D32B09F|nr:membrane-bound alkaline phosphatase-like [Teleopsis dalmanni]
MWSTKLFLIFLLQYCVGLPTKTTTTTCKLNNEDDCLDAVMHPDLSPTPNLKAAQNGEDTQEYWLEKSRDFIRQQANQRPNRNIAKNVILFIGDGMGLATLAAARNLIGGEEAFLSFEKFPYIGLSKTYAVDLTVADSACTATAYLCGVKGNEATIGINGNVVQGDCEGMRNTSHHVTSIAKWAMDANKAAGFVTTTRVTHASPAGVYANIAHREWENDAELKEDCGEDTDLADIALQLIHNGVGSKLKVAMGGGRAQFIGANSITPGKRLDGRNLINEYLSGSAGNAYVTTKQELDNLDLDKTERLLGLFQDSHMDYHLDAVANEQNTQPTLAEMTQKAIEFMQKEENGFFLFVEGGKIDIAHHNVLAKIALDETVEFAKAIELARNITSEDDTLIVVSADHSHSFSLAGYQNRGSDIFGLANGIAEDNKRYLALSYANGPSFDTYFDTKASERRRPEDIIQNSAHDVFPATAPFESETHGGEDVPVYASGPWSHLFTGVYEQNAIPHMMAYASCIGEGLKACET